MAVVFIEGFDAYGVAGSTQPTAIMGTYWDSILSTPTCQSPRLTSGGQAISINDSNGLITEGAQKVLPQKGIYTVGAAVWRNNSAGRQVWSFGDSSGVGNQVSLAFNTNHNVVLYRGNYSASATPGTALATGTKVCSPSTWNYIEMRAGISASTGFIEVRINNVTDLLITGVNTKNTANSFIDRFCLYGENVVYFDDLYITDETTPNSGFLGDCRVQTLLPTGNGNQNDWSVSGAASGWAAIDDTSTQIAGAYSDTDYVMASSTGNKFVFSFADLSGNSPTVFAASLSNVSKKGDAGARTCQNVVRTNSAEASGTEYSLSTSYINYTTLWNQNPVTGSSWTPTEINNIQCGQVITT